MPTLIFKSNQQITYSAVNSRCNSKCWLQCSINIFLRNHGFWQTFFLCFQIMVKCTWTKMARMCRQLLVLCVLCISVLVRAARWSHSKMLSPDYRLLWSLGPGPQDITFELQVRTLGYVGFGFSKDGKMDGADMIVGWVDHGQVYFQVSTYNGLYWNVKNCHYCSFMKP